MKPPQTKKELSTLLGAFGYYREYIPHYSDIARSLTDLTKKGVPNVPDVQWTTDCQQAFVRLRSELTSDCTLRIPTIGTPFILHTDYLC